MHRAPGAERRRGLVTPIDTGEDGTLGVDRDRHLERAFAPRIASRSPIDSQGQEPTLDAGLFAEKNRETQYLVAAACPTHVVISRKDLIDDRFASEPE